MAGTGKDKGQYAKASRPRKQIEGGAPVINNPKLPKMTTDKKIRPKRIRGKVVRMAKDPVSVKGGKNRMHPLSSERSAIQEVTIQEYPLQIEKKRNRKRYR
jgi:hypothetical protein